MLLINHIYRNEENNKSLIINNNICLESLCIFTLQLRQHNK